MYSVSSQFHTAVFENSPITQVLFRFADGTIFTNEDVHLSSGVKIMEASNYEEELTIGACLSSTLSATFMNYHGLLSGYTFGECEVSLGVKIGTDTFVATVANVTAIQAFGEAGAVVYTGHSTAPYLRANGVAAAEQPSFAVHSIAIYDGEILCIGSDGETWTTAAFAETVNTGDFMTAKYAAMAASHLGYDFTDDVLHVFSEYGTVEIYEFAKLGVFIINTPKKRNTNLVSISTAYDRMSLFDMSANDFLGDLTYPITLGAMFVALCTLVGVDYKASTFTNSTHSVASVLLEETEITAKDILKWIAEAAGSFARMTRDGEVELAWFADVDIDEIPETQCFKANIADYSVATIDKLEMLSSDTSINAVVGTGTNSYVIINNPFLRGVTAGDVAVYGAPIYAKLAAFPSFYPLAITAVCDWSIQAGDVVSIEHNGISYDLPIYCQTIIWKGDAKVSYESTGAEKRPVIDLATREMYRIQAGVESSVKQGEAYNDVKITHADGVVTTAVISGKTISIKQNGQEGLAVYDGATYVGGVKVVDGKVLFIGNAVETSAVISGKTITIKQDPAVGLGIYDGSTFIGGIKVIDSQVVLVSNLLTNDIDGDCYAVIGDVEIDEVVNRGIFVYNKDVSETEPTLQIVAEPAILNDEVEGALVRILSNNGTQIWFGAGDIYQFYVWDKNNKRRMRVTYVFSEMTSPNGLNHVGVDDGGVYKQIGETKTYL